jgi:hypothetical protein
MNKYLLLSAVAALASGNAHAGTAVHSWKFASSAGGTYCDGGTLYTNGTSLWAWRHTNIECRGVSSTGYGRFGRLDGFGKGAAMSDNLVALNYGTNFFAVSFVIPKKIKDGAHWELDVGFTGTTAFIGNSGTLVNVTNGAHAPTSHGTVSTMQAVRDLIAARKAKIAPR